MNDPSNEKTTKEYWDGTYAHRIAMRLPARVFVGVADLMNLLASHVHAGMKVLEIGCAPGKMLSHVAARLGAEVAGIDYSTPGTAAVAELFGALGLAGDIRCEDVFATTFPDGSFDVVYSVGVIEHFEDPAPLVRKHVELLRPGGLALITVPNYGGIYGTLQGRFDPENLAIHNLRIMSPAAMEALAPRDLCSRIAARPYGRFNTGLISLERKIPRPIAKAAFWLSNGLGWLQPFRIAALSPMIALEATRKP